MVFAVDAVGVEQALHVDRQGEVVVLFLDGLHQRLAFAGAAGVQLEQAVATAVQLRFEGLRDGRGLRRAARPRPCLAAVEQRQARAELVLQGVAGGAGIEEGVQRLVVPLEQALLGAVLQVRYVQLDGVSLADPVEGGRCAARAGPGGPAGRTAPDGGRTGSCGLRCRFPSRSAPGRRTLRRRSRRRRGRAPRMLMPSWNTVAEMPERRRRASSGRGPSRRGHR